MASGLRKILVHGHQQIGREVSDWLSLVSSLTLLNLDPQRVFPESLFFRDLSTCEKLGATREVQDASTIPPALLKPGRYFLQVNTTVLIL